MLILSKVAAGIAVCALLVATLRLALADVRVGRAHAVAGDTLVIDGETLRLAGIRSFSSSAWCEIGGERWPCGAASTAALARQVNGRIVLCRVQRHAGIAHATCHVGLENLARVLVRAGWAIPTAGNYAREAQDALRDGRGLWPRPRMARSLTPQAHDDLR